ncbi:MAG TPA: tryptophan 2,3-dioxygenase family protein, partial [Gemmatimonadales bacterium]
MSITYGQYLKLKDLLALQEPRAEPPQHDEMLFIVIHQVYELWFKLLLHEIDRGKAELSADDLFGAIARFKRLRTVLKTLVEQLDVLETMTPMSFLAFRDRLEAASGFQSAQFRALEFVLGAKRREMLGHYSDPAERALLERRLAEPSLLDAFYVFLGRRGVSVPAALSGRDVTLPNEASPALQPELVRLFKAAPEVAILLELMTDFDEGLQEWRYRHVKMVERTIGNKKGTG